VGMLQERASQTGDNVSGEGARARAWTMSFRWEHMRMVYTTACDSSGQADKQAGSQAGWWQGGQAGNRQATG
jgi:hypothetical protein